MWLRLELEKGINPHLNDRACSATGRQPQTIEYKSLDRPSDFLRVRLILALERELAILQSRSNRMSKDLELFQRRIELMEQHYSMLAKKGSTQVIK